MADFNIQGLEGVLNKLQQLPARMQKSGVRKAARKAMNIVRDAARANALVIDDPETKAKIQKNIGVQAGKTRDKNIIKMRVGVRGGASSNQHSKPVGGLSGGDTRHWRYIELGTSNIPAAPFMRPALSENIESVTNTFVEELKTEINLALSQQ